MYMSTMKSGLSHIRELALEVKKGIEYNQLQRKHRQAYADKLDLIIKTAEFLAQS